MAAHEGRTEVFYAAVFAATVWGVATAVLWPGNLALTVVAAFAGVIGAALMISLGAEIAEFFVSQGLAVAAIALCQTAPEMAVEATIAYRGQVPFMLANFTGSNRLLMGAGWPMIYAVAAFANRRRNRQPLREIRLRPENVIETVFLVLPSLYMMLIVAKGTLTLLDSVVLAGMFVAYIVLLNRLPPEEEETKEDLIRVARNVVEMRRSRAVAITLVLILVGGVAVILVAEPFVTSLEALAATLGIGTFFFIQWVAPFLSEFPESLVAFYWARRIRLAPMALLNMISSKINQWTLLILFIPLFYSLGQGHLADVDISGLQRLELFVTIAMTVYGATILLKRRFTAANAAILFGLWFFQFLFPTTVPGTPFDSRLVTAEAFLLLAAVEFVWRWRDFRLLEDLRETRRRMRARRPARGSSE